MSYCRFGDNDAYIFLSNQGLECCACSMATRVALEIPYTDTLGIHHDFDYEPVGPFSTAQKMLDHIAEHRANGDHISLDVDERLRKDFPNLNASVKELNG